MNQTVQWQELIGKRCLVKTHVWDDTEERVVLELAPSGRWVKLSGKSGEEKGIPIWAQAKDLTLVEILDHAAANGVGAAKPA